MSPPLVEHPVRRNITTLVTDLTGFTPFADITEPEYVFETLSEYHGLVGGIVEPLGGEVIDIAGDIRFFYKALWKGYEKVQDNLEGSTL